MRRFFTGFLVLVFSAAVAGADQVFDVQATQVVEHGHLTLRFKIENVSTGEVTLNNSDLPWGSTQSVTVSVKTKGSDKAVPQLPVFNPPALGQLVLEPHQTLIGDYEVVLYGERLDTLLDKGDLVVDWSYAPHAADGTSLGTYSGRVDVRPPLHR